MSKAKWRSTTILCVRNQGSVALAGDGQVTLGNTVMKTGAKKVRKLYKNTVLSGFAGSAADAFALLERFEVKLEEYSGDLMRASVLLAKDWRLDKALRQLDAVLLVADTQRTLLISGTGNVIEPDDQVAAIGSGGSYALAAARAFLKANPEMSATEIAKESLLIASEICIYTNNQISVQTLDSGSSLNDK